MLCSYDQEGAFGVILNRPLEIDINIILKQVPITFPKLTPKPALFGGPVEMTSCMILFEGERTIHDVGFSIIDEEEKMISVSPSLKELDRIITDDISFELMLGSAGWGAGQLDNELGEGSWLYSDISPLLLLAVPPSERYNLAITQMGIQPQEIWNMAIEE